MAYNPPTYPESLTKAYWDKKKGLIAKAAIETGIGAAAAKAEAAFAAIDWNGFDIIKRTPMAVTEETLKQCMQFKDSVAAQHAKQVKPAIAALKVLSKTAAEAVPKLKKGNLSNSAKIAEEIAKEADFFSVSLQLNSAFFDEVAKECDKSVEMIENNLRQRQKILSETKTFLTNLLKGIIEFQNLDTPNINAWDKLVKQQGRSVSNNIKGNPDLAKKYLKIWVSKFQGFDWNTLGFDKFKDTGELKTKIGAFIKEVRDEAAKLSNDLK
jgi:hypothetical protein